MQREELFGQAFSFYRKMSLKRLALRKMIILIAAFLLERDIALVNRNHMFKAKADIVL